MGAEGRGQKICRDGRVGQLSSVRYTESILNTKDEMDKIKGIKNQYGRVLKG